jgi:hypothetical protein
MSQFLPADHSRGDANTVGGYTAVHARPPAFEGKDGSSYSVEIMTDTTGDSANPYGGYLLFVRWGIGDPVATGHIETDFLVFGSTEEEARSKMGAMLLNDAVAELNRGIVKRDAPGAPWWASIHDEPSQ